MASYCYKVIKHGKTVAEATTRHEAEAEARRVGGTVRCIRKKTQNPPAEVHARRAEQAALAAKNQLEFAEKSARSGQLQNATISFTQAAVEAAFAKSDARDGHVAGLGFEAHQAMLRARDGLLAIAEKAEKATKNPSRKRNPSAQRHFDRGTDELGQADAVLAEAKELERQGKTKAAKRAYLSAHGSALVAAHDFGDVHTIYDPTAGPLMGRASRGVVEAHNRLVKTSRALVTNPARRAREADDHAARELALYVVNDAHLYLRRLPDFAKNLAAKIKRGTYDEAKAVKLIEYLTKEAAQKYGREFGGTFDAATRRAAAVELLPIVVEQAQEVAQLGAAASRMTRNPASLSAADKRVVKAFTDQTPASSRSLTTDGQRLSGNYMGGDGIATWEQGRIHFHDLGSKFAQTVQRAVAKEAPRNFIANPQQITVPTAAEAGAAVGRVGKKAFRGLVSAGKGLASFVRSARESAAKNPAVGHAMVGPGWILSRKASKATPHEVAIRHSDSSAKEPATVEPDVYVNRYGKIYASPEFFAYLTSKSYYDLTDHDRTIVADLFNRKRPSKR